MASSSSLLAAAVKRLLHDLKEVRDHPVLNVSCMPLEDDLFTWHGNARCGPEGSLKGAPIHFILSFPHDYPHTQPECRLLQPIPHPNVKPAQSVGIQVLHVNASHRQAPGGAVAGSAAATRPHPIPREARWRLALWDCIPGKNSWSSAYSVLSIMLQLQVFLLDEDLQYDTQTITPERAIAKALELECPGCPHAGSDHVVHPRFVSEADLAEAKLIRAKQAVVKPFVPARSRATTVYLKAHQKGMLGTEQKMVSSSGVAGSSCSSSGGVSPVSSSRPSSSSSLTTAASASGSGSSSCGTAADDCSAAEDAWVTVKAKGRAAKCSTTAAVHRCPSPGQAVSSSSFSVLRAANQALQQPEKPLAAAPAAAVPAREVPGLQQQAPSQQLSKAAKKNLARRQKQHQANAAPAAGPAPSTEPSSSRAVTPSASAAAVASSSTADWAEVGAKKRATAEGKQQAKAQSISPLQQQLLQLQQQPMKDLIQQCIAGDTFKAAVAVAAEDDWSNTNGHGSGGAHIAAVQDLWPQQQQHYSAAAAAAAGPFSILPQDALLCIVSQLSTADVASLGQTCKALKASIDDGAVWQLMMAKAFPGAKLTASNMADWKAAYLLEAGCVLDELRCWYTRADFNEDVLGLPLSISVNPATGKVDYIEAHPDLISVSAFKAGVRNTPTGEKFEALLPLYITADHFNRALPHLKPLLQKLAPEHVPRGGGCPPPETWLEVLSKILNTQVVLLADNGITASQRSLAVTCQVYRLLLAVCEHWVLWPKLAARLDAFLQHPVQRIKSATPNLGLLLPLLSCSPVKHSWSKMSGALLEEALDRKVLWMCKKDPGLVQSFQAAAGSAPDMALLRGSWAGAAVSCRLTAFHVAFLQLVAAPRGSSLETVMDSMDAMYGWPAAALGPRFANAVKRIQQLDGWQSWFQLLGRKVPMAQAMSDLLRMAWQRGVKKGYHSAKTDFSRIHASGVSRILLKGQSYSTPPGTKSVELEVHYKWKPEFHVRYLDGAVLLFGPGRKFQEMVAWNNTCSRTTARPGAVTHSGDIMEFEQQQGLNKAKIVFSDLGPDVHEAFITLSGWSTAMLSDIIQPYVQLKEPTTGVELCQCHLDSQDMMVKKIHKCIIMARLYREAAGGWGVQSVGTFCQGNTGSYGDFAHGTLQEHSPVGLMVAGIKALSV